MTSESKKYHAFISHSSHDKDAAKRLALDLQGRGYSVWFDEWEILVGHNIVDEVFGAIKQSHFMVVILSEASVKSRWVDEELTAAKTREIEGEQVVILPAKLENCEIPTALTAKRYADFTGSWDYGVDEIARAIYGHSGNRPTPPTNSIAAPNFAELDQWREDLMPEIASAGFREGQPFKDVLIGLTNGESVDIAKMHLKPIVDASRVHLRRYGGPPFPYDMYPSTNETRLPDGIRHTDAHPRIHRSQSFHFWQIDSNLRFFQRNLIDEDFQLDEPWKSRMSGKLATEWALMHITMPLLFATSILVHEAAIHNLGVKFVWGGLQGRSLLIIHRDRVGFSDDFRCQVPDWTSEIEVTRDTDIAKEALKAALGLFWLFGWDPEPGALEVIGSDLASLANGTLPD